MRLSSLQNSKDLTVKGSAAVQLGGRCKVQNHTAMNIKIVTIQEVENLSYVDLLQYRYKLADLVEKNRKDAEGMLMFSRTRLALMHERVYLNQNLQTINNAIQKREAEYLQRIPMLVLLNRMGVPAVHIDGATYILQP